MATGAGVVFFTERDHIVCVPSGMNVSVRTDDASLQTQPRKALLEKRGGTWHAWIKTRGKQIQRRLVRMGVLIPLDGLLHTWGEGDWKGETTFFF